MKLLGLATFLVAMLLGCSTQSPSQQAGPHQAVLTEAAAIDEAEKYLRQQGFDLSKYTRAAVMFDAQNEHWHITYSGKSLALGDHFGVQLSNEIHPNITLQKGL